MQTAGKYLICPREGERLTFRGMSWSEEGWEFDAPMMILHPVHRYCFTGSHGKTAFAGKVEDLCIDLCVYGHVRTDFPEPDTLEFEWRGWDLEAIEKNADWKYEVTAEFYMADGGMMFRFIDLD